MAGTRPPVKKRPFKQSTADSLLEAQDDALAKKGYISIPDLPKPKKALTKPQKRTAQQRRDTI